MKKLILHIGHGKTASSYLQTLLSLNRELLHAKNIDYPIGRANQEEAAIKGFVNSGNGSAYPGKEERFEKIIQKTHKSQYETVVFSFEGFFKRITP